MKISRFTIPALLLLSGCASIFDGTSQQIMINTNPAGANCTLTRKEGVIGTIASTPASTTVKKTKYDITITCDKSGYQQATYLNHSGIAGATFADIIGGLMGAVAWGIDSAAGADNKYDSPVNLTMVPLPQDQMHIPQNPAGMQPLPTPGMR